MLQQIIGVKDSMQPVSDVEREMAAEVHGDPPGGIDRTGIVYLERQICPIFENDLHPVHNRAFGSGDGLNNACGGRPALDPARCNLAKKIADLNSSFVRRCACQELCRSMSIAR